MIPLDSAGILAARPGLLVGTIDRMPDESAAGSRAFQVDLRGLVDLLSQHLYSSPRVYVRELLQNAVDATTARRQLTGQAGEHPGGPPGEPVPTAIRMTASGGTLSI